MAKITNNTYKVGDKTFDAHTGQEIASDPTMPTAAQLANRTGDAMSAAVNAPVTTPTSSVPSPYYPRYTTGEQDAANYLSTFTAPKDEATIFAEKSKQAQSSIDALNAHYNDLLAEQNTINQGRTRGTDAISTLTGLAGSTEANVQADKTSKLNQKEDQAIQNQRSVAIQSVLSSVRSSAAQAAKDARDEARKSAEDVLKLRADRATEATTQLTTLSAGGATADGLKSTDPESYNYLANQVGGETQLKALFTLNRPKETILDKSVENGKYIIAYQNPITGATRIEQVDLGLPKGYSKSIDAGDRLIFAPDNWDGDTSKLISVNKGLTPKEAADKKGLGQGGPSGAAERDAQSVMAGTLNLQDISVKDNYRASVASILSKKASEALKSGDIYGTMKASAAYDKEPGDTFLQSMEKTASVVQQLSTLQTNIAGTKTGPIEGAFRGANPWDTNAQTIKAQLNAIVPNLARGVYGEVGVLTDNDIKQYSKTIPNLTSTEDIRNAILYITMDQIRKNVETKIKNQAAGQRDMSGYADVYKDLTDTATQVLSTLPNSAAPGGDLKTQVAAKGYNYDQMKADGHSDAEIKAAIGL